MNAGERVQSGGGSARPNSCRTFPRAGEQTTQGSWDPTSNQGPEIQLAPGTLCKQLWAPHKGFCDQKGDQSGVPAGRLQHILFFFF